VPRAGGGVCPPASASSFTSSLALRSRQAESGTEAPSDSAAKPPSRVTYTRMKAACRDAEGSPRPGRGRIRGARHPHRSWSAIVIETVHVIGSGRVGSAVAARLSGRGVAVGEDDPDVVLLCVPDTAILDVARRLTPGRAWVGHVSGATPLAALDPHERRFSLHPLQTFARTGCPSQFDGAWAAVTGDTEDALAVARELAEILGLHPFDLADGDRT